MKTRRVDKDRYGRVVGKLVTTGGDVLNLRMVLAGQAAVYPQHCTEDRYYRVQDIAKAARAGFRARDGLHQTPWKYRHR